MNNISLKIIDIATFLSIRSTQFSNKKIVFTNGCFDIIHSGHITYLYKARECGDILVVGLNTDASVKKLKGKDRPINNQDDRALVLASLFFVDYVILFGEDTPLNLINSIKPDILVKGADYSINEIVGAKEVTANGGEVRTIELVEGKSTTSTLNKLSETKCITSDESNLKSTDKAKTEAFKESSSALSISISIPALNEEKNIGSVISELIESLKKRKIKWQLILINDGSTDKTPEIMNRFKNNYPSNVLFIDRKKNMGLGYSIREGMKNASLDYYTWFPSDGENSADELLKYLAILDYVDILIPFTINKGVRSIFRRILSSCYLSIINISFGVKFNYTNGNIIYRREILDSLDLRSDSFFFQTETLIKALRSKKEILFAEVPIILQTRGAGKASALKISNIIKVCYDYLYMMFYVHIYLRWKNFNA